jgi:hypothetical protein
VKWIYQITCVVNVTVIVSEQGNVVHGMSPMDLLSSCVTGEILIANHAVRSPHTLRSPGQKLSFSGADPRVCASALA